MFYPDRNQSMQGKERLLKQLEANDQRLITAVFDTYPLYAKDVERLVKIIQNNTHLTSLKLLDCQLSAENTERIARAALQNNTLTHLTIELFDNDSSELKNLMDEVQAHLKSNSQTQAIPTSVQ